MMSLRFYRNKYSYPEFSETITQYGNELPCTPIGFDLKSGVLHVKAEMIDVMNSNYIRINRDNYLIYAWIENVKFRTENTFEITYKVDPFRTWKNKINLGTQFIERQPDETFLRDEMLGSSSPYPEIESIPHIMPNNTKRVMVVQCRVYPGEIHYNTPVNPSPYKYYFCEYNPKKPLATVAISTLMQALAANKPENIVTMYSLPYFDLTGLSATSLQLHYASGNTEIEGFYRMNADNNKSVNDNLTNTTIINWNSDTNVKNIMRVKHSVQVVIPEAGIISIPDELLDKRLLLRQDIDIYSGAANYMIVDDKGNNYNLSVRGSSMSSIPVVSDPMETYISQNQNALTTSLLGDVASVAGGIGLGSAGMVMGGVASAASKFAKISDTASRPSNPPAFLGTALAANFNQQFWVIVISDPVDNQLLVNGKFGYPLNKVAALTLPKSGYIKTNSCSVTSSDGSVPKWAIEEVNGLFDNGILVKTS